MLMKITPKTFLKDIINKYPETKDFFRKYGFKCLGCKGIKKEIIREACHMHGVDVEKFIRDLKRFLRNLNEKSNAK